MVILSSSKIEKYIIIVMSIFFVLIALTLPSLWSLPLIGLISFYGLYQLKRKLKYAAFSWQAEETILLRDLDGDMVKAIVCAETVVYPFLIILTVQHQYKERLLLWPDSADKEWLRRFRVWLIWQAQINIQENGSRSLKLDRKN